MKILARILACRGSSLFKKTPLIKQYNMAECGQTCLRILLEYYNISYNLVELSELCYQDKSGSSMWNLYQAAKHYCLLPKAIYCKPLRKLDTDCPAIIYWRGNHFVILESISSKTVTINDPLLGHLTISNSEAERQYSGFALICKPTTRSKVSTLQFAIKQGLSKDFFDRGFAIQCFDAVLWTCFYAISLSIINNLVFQKSQNLSAVTHFQVLLSLILFTGLASLLCHKTLRILNNKSLKIEIERFYQKLLTLPYREFSAKSPEIFHGTLESILRKSKTRNINLRCNMTAVFLSSLLTAILLFLSAKLVVLTYLVWLVTPTLNYLCIGKQWKHHQRASLSHHQCHQSQSLLKEYLLEYIDIKLCQTNLQRTHLIKSRFTKLMHSLYSETIKESPSALHVMSSSILLVTLSLLSLILAVDSYIINWPKLSFSMLLTLQLYSALISIENLPRNLLDYCLHKQRVNDFIASKSKSEYLKHTTPARSQNKTLPLSNYSTSNTSKVAAISMKNVEFSYQGEKSILPPLFTLTLYTGERLAIQGRNGAGKTSLLKLCCGIEAPTQGEILLFNQKMELLSPQQIGRQIQYLDDLRSPSWYSKVSTSTAQVVLLDEATTQLDTKEQAQLFDMLSTDNKALIFTSHDSFLVKSYATRVVNL